MPHLLDVDGLVRALEAAGSGEAELALVDAREQGAYSTSHLLYAANLPRSRADLVAAHLLPRTDVSVAVVDAGGGEAADVASTLEQLGYTDVAVLNGGIDAWAAAGHELYSGVNVPSKLFGELVERHYETPHVSAPELQRWLDEGRKMIVVDSRTEREFNRMSIPTGRSCPGGELVHRIYDQLDDDTTVVVNCAGRTRSILGAQSLRSAGISNPVVALENGTMGWELVDQQLAHGETAIVPPPSAEGRAAAQAAAAEVAARVGVRRVDRDQVDAWCSASDRTTYLLDVRTPAEYLAGHLAGSRSAPGGQLVQATDEYVPVLGARLVVIDDDGTRATMTASWLQQMNWDVAVLAGVEDFDDLVAEPNAPSAVPPTVPLASAAEVDGATVVDVATSTEFRRGHLPGAVWALRGDLGALGPLTGSVVLTSPDGSLAAHAHREAAQTWPQAEVRVLDGGTAAWSGELEQGPDARWTTAPDDVWQLPYDPGDATVAREAMQGYLTWEVDLVPQYDRDPLVHFELI